MVESSAFPHIRRNNSENAVLHPTVPLARHFGKARMGTTHFLMKTLPKAAIEIALDALDYNLTRVMNIISIKPLMAAIIGEPPRS
jgi:transposase